MGINRRQFLKGTLASSLIIISPGSLLKCFPALPKPEEITSDIDNAESTIALGLGNVKVEKTFRHIHRNNAVISNNKSLGIANINFKGSTEWLKTADPNNFQYCFELECAFQKQPHFFHGKTMRVETCFMYPDGVSRLDIILPKAIIVWAKTIDGVDTILFRATPVTNAVWKDYPYGIMNYTT